MARGGGFDMGSILKFGAIGVGGYFLYDWWTHRTPTVTTPKPAATGGTGGGSTAGFTSIDATAARIMAAAGAGATFTADGWNVYLQRELQAGKVAPDPASFIGDSPRDKALTFAQYWGAIMPKLKADLGLSGMGMFYGLGMVGRR